MSKHFLKQSYIWTIKGSGLSGVCMGMFEYYDKNRYKNRYKSLGIRRLEAFYIGGLFGGMVGCLIGVASPVLILAVGGFKAYEWSQV